MGEIVRVLQIVTKMDAGGLECRLMDIYRSIDKSRIQFDFYTCSMDKGVFDNEIECLGGKMYYSEPLDILKAFTIPYRFNSFFQNHREYRIVHCHLNQWCGVILLGAKSAGVPVRIAHSRTAISGGGLANGVRNIIKLPVNRVSTHKLAVSREAGKWLFGERHVECGNVRILPNGIDCLKYRYNIDERLKIRRKYRYDELIVFLHVGNFTEAKNHRFLLHVFSEIHEKNSNTILLMAGLGAKKQETEELSRTLGIYDSVVFLGSRSDIDDLLQMSDVFVFPSLYEGFPGAVLEAEAAGIPCLISDRITNEVCLVENCVTMSLEKSTGEWACEALRLANSQHIDSYAALSAKGYDMKTVVKQYEELYLSI